LGDGDEHEGEVVTIGGPSRDPLGIQAALSMDLIGEIDDIHESPKPAKSLRRSPTVASTTPTRNLPIGDSSDNLMYPERHSNSTQPNRLTDVLEKENDVGPRRRSSKVRVDQGGAGRVRKYKMFENPQTTFFCGGRMMTGGDSVISLILTAVIMLALTGVWLGTTGVWLWVHGKEYGLVKGGGVGIVIVLV